MSLETVTLIALFFIGWSIAGLYRLRENRKDVILLSVSFIVYVITMEMLEHTR